MKIALLSYCILPVVAVKNLPGCNSTISASVSTSRINVAATVSLDFDTLPSNSKTTVLFPNSSTNAYQLPTELQPPSITSNLEVFPTFRPDPTGFSPTTRSNVTRLFSIVSGNTTGRSRSIEQHKTGTSLTKTRAGDHITSSPYAIQSPSYSVQPTSWSSNWYQPIPNVGTNANKKIYTSASRTKTLATSYTHVAAKRSNCGDQGD